MADYRPPPCEVCLGIEFTCEEHPSKPWAGMCCQTATVNSDPAHACCDCGAAGMPCPACNARADGKVSMGDGSYMVPIR